ncbi:MAG TPA: hypothetical protein VFH29_09185 [Anaerolineales bacterium]|nr:hypothetical protein [Anaerolineales bacterium]
MISDSESQVVRTDRNAAISLAAGMLALAAVCIAVIPVPFTGYICFPAAAILTVIAVTHGARALSRFGALRAAEKAMTAAGLVASAMAVLASICSVVIVVILGMRLAEALRQLMR